MADHHDPQPPTTETLEQFALTDLVNGIAKKYGVPLDMLFSRSRSKRVALCRHEVWWAIYDLGTWSLPEIAWLFGRDHTTIRYGVRKFALGAGLATE